MSVRIRPGVPGGLRTVLGAQQAAQARARLPTDLCGGLRSFADRSGNKHRGYVHRPTENLCAPDTCLQQAVRWI